MPEDRSRLRELCTLVLPQIATLGAAVAVQARRRPLDPLPETVLVNGRKLIGQTARILSREAGGSGSFRLGEHPTWSELDAMLQLSHGALTAFAARKETARESGAHRAELIRLINAKIEEGIERGRDDGINHIAEEWAERDQVRQ